MSNAISENRDVITCIDLGRTKATVKVGNGCEKLVELPPNTWSYKAIVTALVRVRYSEDDMEAIVNNNMKLLATPSACSEEEIQNVTNEFQQMQEWREKCKARAKELLEIGEEMGLTITDRDDG